MYLSETEPRPSTLASAPCGPECRFARELPGWSDYIWCTRRGAPRDTSGNYECPYFSPPLTTGSVRAADVREQ